MQGQVKFFKLEKGFGFIVSEEAGNDVFFHISNCVEGYQPQEGDNVTFELGQGRDGRTAAANIAPMEA
jgi:cold shock protein